MDEKEGFTVSGFMVSGLLDLSSFLKLSFKVTNQSRKPETLRPESGYPTRPIGTLPL